MTSKGFLCALCADIIFAFNRSPLPAAAIDADTKTPTLMPVVRLL